MNRVYFSWAFLILKLLNLVSQFWPKRSNNACLSREETREEYRSKQLLVAGQLTLILIIKLETWRGRFEFWPFKKLYFDSTRIWVFSWIIMLFKLTVGPGLGCEYSHRHHEGWKYLKMNRVYFSWAFSIL